MNVLILSDFSEAAINATLYAMDLLKNEQVDFTLANIYVPHPEDSSEDKERKRTATQTRLQERVEKLRERSQGRPHTVTGYYSEDSLVKAARDFVEQHDVDLMVMGSVSKRLRHSTILGNHTFEIISKIRCNILAVPEEGSFEKLKHMLMPIDYSASLRIRNVHFLDECRVFRKTRLCVWNLAINPPLEEHQFALKKEIFNNLQEVRVNFSKLDGSAVYDEGRWQVVQKKFDLIVLLGKNLKICDHLLNNRHGLYTSMPNRLPILVLHD